jgi:hydrogenase expression/formation protein HypC
LLLDQPKVGDWVIVHAGFAIHKIDESDAIESLQALHEVASYVDGGK